MGSHWPIAVANLDQDDDLEVTTSDRTLASSTVGGNDLSADFDCSGAVDSVDMALLASHVGHTSDTTTPVARRSYLKIIYR
jgi:hypothetical protein